MYRFFALCLVVGCNPLPLPISQNDPIVAFMLHDRFSVNPDDCKGYIGQKFKIRGSVMIFTQVTPEQLDTKKTIVYLEPKGKGTSKNCVKCVFTKAKDEDFSGSSWITIEGTCKGMKVDGYDKMLIFEDCELISK